VALKTRGGKKVLSVDSVLTVNYKLRAKRFGGKGSVERLRSGVHHRERSAKDASGADIDALARRSVLFPVEVSQQLWVNVGTELRKSPRHTARPTPLCRCPSRSGLSRTRAPTGRKKTGRGLETRPRRSAPRLEDARRPPDGGHLRSVATGVGALQGEEPMSSSKVPMELSMRRVVPFLAVVFLGLHAVAWLSALQPGTPTKITHVDAVYPEQARQARVQGVVMVQITIGTDGRVSNARVIRSIPLLDQAALDAVKQWVYDAKSIKAPVTLTVTVPFGVAAPSAAIAPPASRPAAPVPAGGAARAQELITAASKGDTTKVLSLLKNGIDVNVVTIPSDATAVDLLVDHELTALMAATAADHVGTVRALLDAGADVNTQGGGVSALMVAATRPSDNGEKILKLLLARRAAVDAKDRKGDTALHYAARILNHPAVIDLVIVADADPDARGFLGTTPLIGVALAGMTDTRNGPGIFSRAAETAETLIDAGADVNLANDSGLTPLIAAVQNGNVPLVRLLLVEGADVNARGASASGTALSAATRRGYTEIVQLLRKAGAKQ